ncbi:photosynthetic NDH subunit of lumenal location 3, chloroplastic [Diospyros lotus]|uniref:photosynthetic NDH subunit of lumenal location 3, chloroplastic n=1 Tax=Diospyros lotus TaxID=55363 RepID=UPI00224EDDF8|nr:photosynthetic NDH subunit of lumenal location 3, chloroplastic [Diospyros lotus]
MALSANLNRVSETFPAAIPRPPTFQRRHKRRAPILAFSGNKAQQHPLQQTTRRLAIGLTSIALFANSGIGNSLAEDNGLWLTGPIPVPPVYNKIANEETGTRSFIKNGIYIANIGTKGRTIRLKKYAFDLLALGDLIGQDAWNYVSKYLRLKSTFMYYDFDNLISAAAADEKQPLTNLANRLFDSVEKLEDAVKKHDLPQTESCYQDTTTILQEVMSRMA